MTTRISAATGHHRLCVNARTRRHPAHVHERFMYAQDTNGRPRSSTM
jgi:hypothetical protein